jgi:hypothetical protein
VLGHAERRRHPPRRFDLEVVEKPRSRAMASAVVESSPPESKTTALGGVGGEDIGAL